jgi:septum formation protein
MSRIVLASASPRRQALLAALGVEFEVMPSNATEHFEGRPDQMVVSNARAKRDDVAHRIHGKALVIAADTLVFLGDEVLGKPEDFDEAKEMIRRLSGRTHEVITGLALVATASDRYAEGHETTEVTFRPLTDQEIDRFVHAVRPMDRAGAYTVDGPGSLLVARYNGCYQNVLGFPIVRLELLMRELGYSLFDLMEGRRAVFL